MTMNGANPSSQPESRLWKIYTQARDLSDPAARAAFLEQSCGADAALRQEVASLLQAETEAPEFLQHDALGGALDPLDEPPGTVIGRYRIVQVLGEGGFGTVYRAEQVEPIRREVALKIIKPGMDTKEVIARFEAERQALALMDHPHIAHVYDAGATATGRPYFVMELAPGMPITQYCDARKLSPLKRLGLFLKVCSAIQHAHQKGIIHRDLKPSNIVVTDVDGEPTPKVIDFGIAKSLRGRLTLQTLLTRRDLLVGTPAYMSPEQMDPASEDVDTRSDIYSLGVLLYELLTGSQPFATDTLHQAALEEIRRLIQEKDPPKPSTRLQTMGEKATEAAERRSVEVPALRRLLRGDLDWIVMKALEKDRTRRYDTASGLARDIEQHLRHEPVSAGPPSTWYRFQKFAQRRRRVLAAVGSIMMVLVGASIFSVWQAAKARQNAAVARQMESQAREAEAKAEASADKLKRTLVRTDFATANDLFDANEGNRALAHLARALRNDPSYWPAAMRLVSALTYRGFGFDRMPDLGHPCGEVLQGEMSGGGELVVTLGRDGELRSWRTTDSSRLAIFGKEQGIKRFFLVPQTHEVIGVGADGGAWRWNISDGRLIEEMIPRSQPIKQAALLQPGPPEKTRFVTLTDAGQLECLSLLQGKPQGTPQVLSQKVSGFFASASGRLMAARVPPDQWSVFDVATGDCVAKWNLQTDQAPVFSEPGRWVAFAEAKSIAWFDLEQPDRPPRRMTREKVLAGRATITNLFTVGHIVFSLDQTRLCLVLKQTNTAQFVGITVDASTGEAVARFAGEGVTAYASNPEVGLAFGLFAAVQEKRQLKVWNVETGGEVAAFAPQEREITLLCFSPEGTRLAVADEQSTVRVWDVLSAQPMSRPIPNRERLKQIVFSPDGAKLLTSGDDAVLNVYSSRTGEPLREPRALGLFGSVRGFSPDCTRALVHVSIRTYVGTTYSAYKLLDCVGQQAQDPEVWPQEPIAQVRLASAPGLIAVSLVPPSDRSGSSVVEYDLISRHTNVQVFLEQKLSAGRFFGQDLEYLVGQQAGNRLCVYRWRSGTLLAQLESPAPVALSLLSENGTTLFTADLRNRFSLWNISQKRIVTRIDEFAGGDPVKFDMSDPFPEPRSANVAIHLSPDGRWLAIADIPRKDHHSVRVWDLRTGERKQPDIDFGWVGTVVKFSPDKRSLLVGHVGPKAQLHELATGKPVRRFNLPGWLRSCDFTPDGRHLATMAEGGNDRRMYVRIWDMATGDLLCAPAPCNNDLRWVRFCADGKLIVGGLRSPSEGIKLWDTETGLPVIEPRPPRLPCLLPGPNGRSLAEAQWDNGYRGFRLRWLPERSVPVPSWLPDLAEAVAHTRLNPLGIAETMDRSPLPQVVEQLERENPEAPHVRWARWFLEDPNVRSLNPYMEWRPADAVAALLARPHLTLSELQDGLLLMPASGDLMSCLAQHWRGPEAASAKPDRRAQHWMSPPLWYSCQATNLAPDKALVWKTHAEILGAVGQTEAAQRATEVAAHCESGPTASAYAAVQGRARVRLAVEQGEHHGRMGRWSEAGQVFARAVLDPAFDFAHLDGFDPMLSLKIGPPLVLIGETNAYEKLCRQLLAIPKDRRQKPERHLRMLLLGPPSDPELLRRSIDLTRNYYDTLPLIEVWEEMSRGMAEYRAGRWANALRYSVRGSQSGLDRLTEVTPMCFAAMAAFRLGRTETAWTWLAVAEDIWQRLPRKPGVFRWWEIIGQVNLQEARQIVGPIPDAHRQAVGRMIELIDQADRVGRKGDWSQAARFYGEAMGIADVDFMALESFHTILAKSMASAFLFAGDTQHYRRLCGILRDIPVEHLRDVQIERHVTAILIGGDTAGPDLCQAAVTWAQTANASGKWDQDQWWQMILALGDYRQQRYVQSLRWKTVPRLSEKPIFHVHQLTIDAMSAARLGDLDRARRDLEQAEAVFANAVQKAPGDFDYGWSGFPNAKVLFAEARALLEASQKPKR